MQIRFTAPSLNAFDQKTLMVLHDWCRLYRIHFVSGDTGHGVSLLFQGDGRAMQELIAYLQQRSQM